MLMAKHMLDAGAHSCACGAPTVLASFKERAEYEVTQCPRQNDINLKLNRFPL